MKQRILALGCMAALLCFASNAYAAGNGTATATIATSISVAKLATGSSTGGELAFGNLIPSASAGTVVIHYSTGVRTFPTSAVTGTSLLPYGNAQFQVTGDAGATYTVTLPAVESTLTNSNSDTMTVDTFTKDLSGTGTLTGGTSTFHVGGTLHVGANQASGTYTGTFNVTAAYN